MEAASSLLRQARALTCATIPAVKRLLTAMVVAHPARNTVAQPAEAPINIEMAVTGLRTARLMIAWQGSSDGCC